MSDADSSPLASTGMAQGDVVYGRRANGHDVQFTMGEMAYTPIRGTFVANGASAVTVAAPTVAITSGILISLNTVGGTVGAIPAVKTITAGTGFTVAATASDTSTYNYVII